MSYKVDAIIYLRGAADLLPIAGCQAVQLLLMCHIYIGCIGAERCSWLQSLASRATRCGCTGMALCITDYGCNAADWIVVVWYHYTPLLVAWT